jgi:hypothetical protein
VRGAGAHQGVSQPRGKTLVARLLIDACDLHQRAVAASVNPRRGIGRPSRYDVDVVRQMVEETHAVEIPHRASLALFEIEADRASGGRKLVGERQQARCGVHHDLAADGKVEKYGEGLVIVRTARIQEGPLELRYVDPPRRETHYALHDRPHGDSQGCMIQAAFDGLKPGWNEVCSPQTAGLRQSPSAPERLGLRTER